MDYCTTLEVQHKGLYEDKETWNDQNIFRGELYRVTDITEYLIVNNNLKNIYTYIYNIYMYEGVYGICKTYFIHIYTFFSSIP